jgi:cytochrome c556
VTPEKMHNSSSSNGTSFEKNNYVLGSFQSNQKKKEDAVALQEAEVSSSCGSCNKSIRASPMVLSM